jgi:CDP-glucose 4,6-dehydratase
MNKEFWKDKNVLVTGAGGFKGAHLVEMLSQTGANIVSLVRSFDPDSYFMKKGLDKKSSVVIGDLKDYRKIADILSKYEITSIFHLGAQPIVTTALVNPLETLESNIMGTVNILDAARLYSKAEEIIIVSSDKAYGPCENLPYNEEERLHGKAPYDVSKSCADMISQMYAKVYGMPVVVARCANVFGPGDLNMTRIIPGVIKSILEERVFKIRSDGRMIREYIYVKDSILGYIALAENIEKTRGEAFNISSRHVMDVLEVVNNVSNSMGVPVKTEILNIARTEIPKQHLDGSKIKYLIGWEAETPFETAIRETFEWYKENR